MISTLSVISVISWIFSASFALLSLYFIWDASILAVQDFQKVYTDVFFAKQFLNDAPKRRYLFAFKLAVFL